MRFLNMINKMILSPLVYLFLMVHLLSEKLEAQPVQDTTATLEKAYQQRITSATLHGVYIPKDLTDAFSQLNELMVPETRNRFKSMPEEELDKMNSTLGNWIRANWGFHDGSRLTVYLNQYNVSWPEDMSHVIIITYHRYLNNKPLNLKELVDHYTEKKFNYWKQRAINTAAENEDNQ